MQSQTLRVYHDNDYGHTAFFRNRPLLDTLLETLRSCPQPEFRVLFHACSIGAEPYSFAIAAQLAAESTFDCYATDRNAGFLSYARSGVYPTGVLDGLTDSERRYFESVDAESCAVVGTIRDRVTFLPAGSFSTFESESRFDIVFLSNALLYVDEAEQARTIDRIASYNTGLLVTTAFHMRTIKSDLERNGYEPIATNIETIHDSWEGRRNLEFGFMIPGVTHTSPALGHFGMVTDFEWKHCALFRKAG